MRRNEHLLTRQGAVTNYLTRFTDNVVFYTIEGNPLSKNSINYEEKLKFQLEFINQMKRKKRRAYRENTEICIDMRIFTNADNPPHIQTIPKNYLDLLSKPVDGSKINRNNILFNDDKQVSYLNVVYEMENVKKPRIEFMVYKYRHLIEDIRLAQALILGYFNDEDDEIRHINSLNVHDKSFFNAYKDYSKYIQDGEAYKSRVVDWFELFKIQDALFRENRFKIHDMFRLLCDSIPYYATINNYRMNIYKKIKEEMGDLSLKNDISSIEIDRKLDELFKIKIDKLPSKKGDTKLLKEEIRYKMREYKSKYTFLNQLVIPVSLKVLYKPFENSIFHKDLDNIMKIVVPIFHDEFKPPVSIQALRNYEDNFGENIETIKRIPKGINYQIRGYEIIKVPKGQAYDSEGYIVIGISDGYSPSLISYTNKIILND